MFSRNATVRSFLSLMGGILTGTVAYASATALLPVRVPHAEGGPDNTSWILIGTATKRFEKLTKSATGAQLQAFKTAPQVITPELNPILGSSGQIAGPGPFKDCACIWHYHGTLLGNPDPDPGHCGWGCAVPFDKAGDATAFLSGATMLEARAAKRMTAIPPDDSGALQDVNDSLDQLKGCLDAVTASAGAGALSKKGAKQVEKAVNKAGVLDEHASAILQKLVNHQGGDAEHAISDILEGIGQKQKAMLILAKELKLNTIH